MAIANTISKEVIIKMATTDPRNITRDYAFPGFSRKVLVPNPALNNSGFINLCTSNTNWQQLTSDYNATLVELHSEKPMYIKIEKNALGFQIIHSNVFSYENSLVPIKVSVCNGTLDYDDGLDIFTTNNTSIDSTAYFITLKHSNVC